MDPTEPDNPNISERTVIEHCKIGQVLVNGPVTVNQPPGAGPMLQQPLADSICVEQFPSPSEEHAVLPPKRIEESPISPQLEEILNKSLNEESKRISRSVKNLRTPLEEKWPEMRERKIYDSQPPKRTMSVRDLETYPEIESSSKSLVSMNNIFSSDERFVVIFGGPGSGRSTFVRRYGEKVLKNEIDKMKGVTIVYFVDARRLTKDQQEVTFWQFFFAKLVHGFDAVSEEAITSLRIESNQRKILIIIDGLEYLKHLAMDVAYEAIEYDQRASPAAAFHNLLRGRLLPGAKILAASRSYGIQNYVNEVRPQRTIKLTGFNESDTKYLFKEMVGEVVGKRWEIFSPTKMSLCSTPLYLSYLASMQSSESDLKWNDVTSILMCLIHNFWNKYGWERNPETFKQLKEFCLKMCIQGISVFATSDIPDGQLKDTIMRLCNDTPAADEGVMERSPDGSFVHFSHILIQESLACLGFLDLPEDKYKEIREKYFNRSEFATIKQLACGILSNGRNQFGKLYADIPSRKEKRNQLLETLRLPLSKSLSPEDMFHHLECLHEMEYDIKESYILPDAINLSRHDLTTTTNIIARAIAKCKYLTELVLYHCVLDDSKIKILRRCLTNADLKIDTLNLGLNPDITAKGMKNVAKTTYGCQVRHLDLHACKLTSSHMTAFRKVLRGYRDGYIKIKLESLSLGVNQCLGKSGLGAVGGIVEVSKLKKLDVRNCDVSAANIKELMTFDLRSLKILVLTGYTKQPTPRMQVVGECVTKNGIEELHINWCDLQFSDLQALEKSLGDYNQLNALNISNNKMCSQSECYAVLHRIVKKCGTERMDIHNCELSDDQKKELKQSVKEFSRMDTYLSMDMASDNFRKLLERSKGRFLEVSLRGTRGRLRELPQKLQNYGTQFRKLCLPEGRTATQNEINSLLEILPFISEELWLGEWDINEAGKRSLQAGVDEHGNSGDFKIHLSADGVLRRSNS